MTYHIAICDDEEDQLRELDFLVSEWGHCLGFHCEVRLFTSAEAFLFEYDEKKCFDILLLDIEMKEISGLELARRIRKQNRRTELLFITSHFEFISEGYEVDALHYLTKPVSREKLMSVLSRAAEKLSLAPPSLVITCEGETLRLYESDILYAEAFLHYVCIHTHDAEYKIRESISSFEKKLSDDFFRCHRSYLVSLKHITRISRTCVTVGSETRLPLSRGKYDAINLAFIRQNEIKL